MTQVAPTCSVPGYGRLPRDAGLDLPDLFDDMYASIADRSSRKLINHLARSQSQELPEAVCLYGALGSRYRTKGQQVVETTLWAELSPFLLMDTELAIAALTEYVVWQEWGAQ